MYTVHYPIDGRGDWSKDGCNIVPETGRYQDIVVCECNHLSTFGVFVVSYVLFHLVNSSLCYNNYVAKNCHTYCSNVVIKQDTVGVAINK